MLHAISRSLHVKPSDYPHLNDAPHSHWPLLQPRVPDSLGLHQALDKHDSITVRLACRFTVGCLSEMPPQDFMDSTRAVTCLLGLNVNQGQEIKLRLRTNDLKVPETLRPTGHALQYVLQYHVAPLAHAYASFAVAPGGCGMCACLHAPGTACVLVCGPCHARSSFA